MKTIIKSCYIYVLIVVSLQTKAQNIAINTDGSNADPSAILDVKSNNKGMLVPRMTTAQRTGIGSPAAGLLVYDTDTNNFWFYNGAGWTQLTTSGGSSNQWTTTGNNISNNNSGNVGIGMLASPTAKLSIGGGLNIFSGTTQVGSMNPNGDNTIFNSRLGNTILGTPAGDIILQNSNSANTTTGNVGIGTDAPSEKLDVNGNALISGNLSTLDKLYAGSDVYFAQGLSVRGNLENDGVTTIRDLRVATITGNAVITGGLTILNNKGVAYNPASATNLKIFPFTTETFVAVLPGFGLSAEGAIAFNGGFTGIPRVIVGDEAVSGGTVGELHRIELKLYGCTTTSGVTNCKARLLNTSPNPVNYSITWNCVAIGE